MPRTVPVAFGHSAGHLTLPAAGEGATAGFVFCRAWGMDELCTRKFLRRLADGLAQEGFPALRFDYPGTVDSLDINGGETLEDWIAAADAACDHLKALAGCDRVVPLGLGLGALVAEAVARRRPDIAGLVLLAPVPDGRRYLRETGIKAKVVLEGLGLPADTDQGGSTAIAGIVMPTGVAADLAGRRLGLEGFSQPFPCLVLAREAVAGDTSVAKTLEAAGQPVTLRPFDGYEKLMENPTFSVLPQRAVEDVARWAADVLPRVPVRIPDREGMAALTGDGFREEGVALRPDAPVQGILCRPAGPSHPRVVVFVNSGYDHRGGWGRCWVEAARSLARRGIPSLRFDLSNIGDSPAKAGEPDQVLYTEGPVRDVSDVLDWLETALPGHRPVVVGRCSGAYTAFHAACRDPRIAAIGLVNQLRFIWDPQESLVEARRMGPRPVGEYKRRLVDPKTFRRLLKGEIDMAGVLRAMAIHTATRLSHALAPVFPAISKYARFRQECHRMFGTLNRRGVRMAFLSSEQDESLEQLELYFGKGRRGLSSYANVGIDLIPGADHNLTPAHARRQLRDWLEGLAGADARL